MRKYNIINNSLGWLCFVIAAVTYMLTLEPTASFWDCPEFISQGYKLEVGHPPGNPIFILAARFFINFAGNDPANAAIAVNAMSGLLSAATILLLFWTITYLMRLMLVGRTTDDIPAYKTVLIMGAGLVGSLVYTWSDTFWFSAVEGEVYAFSSFCTALVVWLILKWDNRADQPHSDRYLILVAYIIGISIAVHLLNLLTIPALALIVYFRKRDDLTLKGTLMTLLGSFIIIALILFGLVPGFVELAQKFELFFVNTLHAGYNTGVVVYTVLLVGVLVWCVRSLYVQKSLLQIRLSFLLSVVLSGIPFIGDGWVIPALLSLALVVYLFRASRLYLRPMMLVALSILVIFAGYSSYALILIRANANPPMSQNAVDNVFALGSYLNREQYGQTPLLYGQVFDSKIKGVVKNDGTVEYLSKPGKPVYYKAVKENPDEPDRYVEMPGAPQYEYTTKMFFPRMYSTTRAHADGYLGWIGESAATMEKESVSPYLREDGQVLAIEGRPYTEQVMKPTFLQNLRYFFTYQLNYMYWRYFMWNFAGRQNDLQGQGEVNRGNWISGIPFIDNARLGDQSLLPDDFGAGNKGHNVFYMLPLLLGLLGIATQLVRGIEGVKSFWIVFFLFFMTGIAIVLYLNQPPGQPRERDYAFAGSFYAFSIWIGMGVYIVWMLIDWLMGEYGKMKAGKRAFTGAVAASLLCLLVPLQVVSQTWDDHDRSGRYTTRDFGMNYLSSLDENAIIFTNGDNDTFPLWYAQEVEGYRTDVRVVNLAYLTTEWYANHAKMPAYDAAAIDFLAKPEDYAYDRLQMSYISDEFAKDERSVDIFAALRTLYNDTVNDPRILYFPKLYIPVNLDDAVAKRVIEPRDTALSTDAIFVDLSDRRGVSLADVLSLDMIANGAADGWKRPAYFAMTVPEEYYLNMQRNLRSTGLAYQVTPAVSIDGGLSVSTDKMYDNVMNRFRWGGLDKVGENGSIYLDETVRRMVTTHRSALLDLANALYQEGIDALYYDLPDTVLINRNADIIAKSEGFFSPDSVVANEAHREFATDRFNKSVDVLRLLEEKLPTSVSPYEIQVGQQVGNLFYALGQMLGDDSLRTHSAEIYRNEIQRYKTYIPYLHRLILDESLRREAAARKTTAGVYNLNTGRATINDINVSRTDRYVPYYLYYLLQDYENLGDVDEVISDPEFNMLFDIIQPKK